MRAWLKKRESMAIKNILLKMKQTTKPESPLKGRIRGYALIYWKPDTTVSGSVLILKWDLTSRKCNRTGIINRVEFPSIQGSVHMKISHSPFESHLRKAGLHFSNRSGPNPPFRNSKGSPERILEGTRSNRKLYSDMIRSSHSLFPVTHIRTAIRQLSVAFVIEIIDGHVRSMQAPVGLNTGYLSRRSGQGRVSITADGRWITFERLLTHTQRVRYGNPLFIQLRDIIFAEAVADILLVKETCLVPASYKVH